MLLNLILVRNLAKICKKNGSLGSSCIYRSFRRKLMQQSWDEKTTEIINYKEKIFIVENEKGWEEISPLIHRDITAINAVGFDCEWAQDPGNPGRKPIALMQLATYSGNCVLFRLKNLYKVPYSLEKLLEDRKILKVGVGAYEDASYFTSDHNVIVSGWMDLRHLAIEDGLKNRKLGLKSLAKHYLDKTLSKDFKLRTSNWESEILTDKQVMYAAEDALVGIRILLAQLRNLWKPSVEESWEASMSKAIEEVCDPYVEITIRERKFCFVCGNNSSIQKNVIPKEYIKFFPPVLQNIDKDRVSVLLCANCCEKSYIEDDNLKRKLAEECDAPIERDANENLIKKEEALKACKLFLRNAYLPPEEIKNMENTLSSYFLSNSLVQDDLITGAKDLQTQIKDDILRSHGYKVFKYYEKIGLIHLITRWRNWFISSMKPKYVPEYWSLTDNEHCSWLKRKMSYFPLDSDFRDDIKLVLVGSENEMDEVPYYPDKKSRRAALNSLHSNSDVRKENTSKDLSSLGLPSKQDEDKG